LIRGQLKIEKWRLKFAFGQLLKQKGERKRYQPGNQIFNQQDMQPLRSYGRKEDSEILYFKQTDCIEN